jgi:hypothetical protein
MTSQHPDLTLCLGSFNTCWHPGWITHLVEDVLCQWLVQHLWSHVLKLACLVIQALGLALGCLTEIHQLDGAICADNVLWLQVPVHNADLVQCCQCAQQWQNHLNGTASLWKPATTVGHGFNQSIACRIQQATL